MEPPAPDRNIGMEVYSTDILGIGGRIKDSSDQFIVEEILDLPSDLAKKSGEDHPYPLYMMRKDGIDSSHAVREVEVETGLRLKIVGLKDAKAVTRQYASVIRKTQNATEKIVTEHCMLELVGYTAKPLTKGRLIANAFTITVNDFSGDADLCVRELHECINNNAIANFYGYQRFGSARPVTHLVGREIIRRNFKEAVDLFLTYTAEGDYEHNREVREMCIDHSNFANVLKIMPKSMDLERMMIMEIMRSNDPIKAIRALPITIRRLLVQAYQSYIFNRTLSAAVKSEYDITSPEQNDICYSFEGYNQETVSMKKFDESVGLQIPAIPLAGYAFRDGNRFSAIVRKIMEEDHVTMKDFYIKELQEVSAEGGFRQAPMLCRQFSYSNNGSLRVRFVLPKGSYATILLRELMKPADPITAGF